MSINIQDAKDLATILGVIIAVVVYVTNSVHHYRQSIIDNALRFIEAHQNLVDTEFLSENIREMEKGTFRRDTVDEETNKKFIKLLRAIEQTALLQKARAIPSSVNTYMFGWMAQQIQPLLTPDERNDIYWALAVEFLDEMKSLADDFDRQTKNERVEYFKNINFYK